MGFADRSTTRSGSAMFGAVGMALVGLALVGLSPPADAAGEKQFREVDLDDGRTLFAEVLATEPQGLLMAVPQGSTLISFELLVDMKPITEEVYARQQPWVVYYDVPPRLEADVVNLLKGIPGIEPQAVSTPGHGVTGLDVARASACNADVSCIAAAVAAVDPWMWTLGIQDIASGEVAVRAKVNKGRDTNEKYVDPRDRDELWRALHEVLELRPAGSPPRGNDAVAAPSRRPFDERRVIALSFVPVPGVPSLAQRDSGGFALAMSVVVPSTALWVGAVGANGQSMLETGALAVGGYYAVTVFANQVAGMRSMHKKRPVGLTAAPTMGGGAQLVLVGAER